MTDEQRICRLQSSVAELIATIDAETWHTPRPLSPARAKEIGNAVEVSLSMMDGCKSIVAPALIALHYPSWNANRAKLEEALGALFGD